MHVTTAKGVMHGTWTSGLVCFCPMMSQNGSIREQGKSSGTNERSKSGINEIDFLSLHIARSARGQNRASRFRKCLNTYLGVWEDFRWDRVSVGVHGKHCIIGKPTSLAQNTSAIPAATLLLPVKLPSPGAC